MAASGRATGRRGPVTLELVREARADIGDAGAHVIQLGGQVRELLFEQGRALVGLDGDFASAPLGQTDQFGCLVVCLLLGAVKRV